MQRKTILLPFSFKTRKTVYIIWSIIPGCLAVSYFYLSIKQPQLILVSLLLLGLIILFFIWFKFFKVTLTNEKMIYRTLFGGRNELFWKDIDYAKFESGRNKHSSFNTPLFRLKLKRKQITQEKDININLMMFNEKDIDLLLSIMKNLGIKIK